MSVFSLETTSVRLMQIDREWDDLKQDTHGNDPGDTPERREALERERTLLIDLIRAIEEYERVAFPYPC